MKSKIAILLLFSTIFGCSKPGGDKAQGPLQSAYEHLDKYEFDKAKDDFEQLAKSDSTTPYIRYANALILEQKRYYFDALNEYIQLSKQDINFGQAFSGIYRIYTYYGQFDKALIASDRAYKYWPDTAQFAIDQFRALTNYGRFQQAYDLAVRNKRALDELSSKLLLARGYCGLNAFDSAKATIQQAEAMQFKTAMQYELLADALESLGLIDSSMVVSRQAADHPDAKVVNITEHFDRSLRHNYYFDSRQAIKLLEQKGAGKEITLQLYVLMAKDQKDYPQAMVFNSELAPIAPRNISTLFFDMTASGPQYSDVSLRNTMTSAINTYLEKDEYNSEVKNFVKAEVQYFAENTDDKITAWNSIRELTGEFAASRQTVLAEAALRYKTGQFDDALKNLVKLREAKRNEEVWLVGIADIYADPDINKHKLAQDVYKQVLTKNKWNKSAFTNDISLLLRIKKYEDGLKMFEEYPHFEKVFPELAMQKALFLLDLNRFDEALKIINDRGKYVKGDLNVFYKIMGILEKSRHDDDITKLARKCAEWAGDNPDILTFAAMFLNDRGKYDEALQVSQKSLTLWPTSTKAAIQKARAFNGQGKRSEAFEIFDSVLTTNPNNGDVNYYYSKILTQEKIDPQRTTNMARSAIRAFYSVEKADLNLCRAYLAFEMDKFAYGTARSGIKDYPDNPEFYYIMGVAASRLGHDDAAKNLNKAIELGLKGDELQTAKEILAKL